MTIAKNIEKIREFLEETKNSKVKLLAVSKYASDEQVLEAFKAGVRLFGENYVQSALKRIDQLGPQLKEINPSVKVEWHLIGQLQKNKVRKVVGKFDCIQSVDSVELAQKISEIALELGIQQKVFLQVNSTGEESKNGFSPEALKANYAALANLSNINVQGLMTMGPSQEIKSKKDIEKLETIFTSMRLLLRELVSTPLDLSMGMSGDYQLAVKNGSNLIRLGRAIFN